MPEQDDFAVLADHERFMWGEGDHNDRLASAREFDAALGRLRAKVAALEAEIERLREYWEASQAVQHGIIDFDLHGAAVDRLKAATAAVYAALNEKEPDAG